MGPARWEYVVAAWLVVAAGTFLLWFGLHTGWVPLRPECVEQPDCFPASGETLISALAGQRLALDGPRYWFLQNLRPPWEPDAKPLLYTHHPNLAAAVYYALTLLGANEPTVGSVWVAIAAFCVGLYYAWLFVRTLSGSASFAMVFLLLMISEFHFNLVFGVNALRGWHWLALFGSAYHFVTWIGSPGKQGLPHAVLFSALTVVAFQIGYDLAAVEICTLLLLIVTQRWWNEGPLRSPGVAIGILVIAVGLPVGVRQLQVIGALGSEFWMKDLYYTAAIKMPFLSSIVTLPPLTEVENLYRSHNAARLVASPAQGIGATLALAVSFWQKHWNPYLGPIRSGVCFGSIVLGAMVMGVLVGQQVTANRSDSSMAESPWWLFRLGRPAIVVGVMIGGQLAGLFVFVHYTVWFWIRYALPLLISSVEILAAFGTLALLEYGRYARRRNMRARAVLVAVCGCALAALAADHVVQQMKNYRATEFLGSEESRAMRREILRKLPSYGVSREDGSDG